MLVSKAEPSKTKRSGSDRNSAHFEVRQRGGYRCAGVLEAGGWRTGSGLRSALTSEKGHQKPAKVFKVSWVITVVFSP